jgi:CSLREA domain-containing protein
VPVLTVTTVDDEGDANPGDGVCETGVGAGGCSLRAAVDEANALGRADLVVPAGTYPDCSQAACSFDPIEVTGAVRINPGGTVRTTIFSLAVRSGGVLSIDEATVIFLDVDGVLGARHLRNWTSTPETAGRVHIGATGLSLITDSELVAMTGSPVRNDGQLFVFRSTLLGFSGPAVDMAPGGVMRVQLSALVTDTDLFDADPGSPGCQGGTVVSLGYNYASPSATEPDPCHLDGPGDLVGVDPVFGSGQPGAGSPLVDHIPVGTARCGQESTDAGGRPRPVDGDGDGVAACDVGADER